MKKLLFILTVLIVTNNVHAQFIYKIKADSVLITNDSCTAELIIENSTKSVKGFLVNKGNGRTEFRRAQKLTDSSFIVAGDTIILKGAGIDSAMWKNDGILTGNRVIQTGNYDLFFKTPTKTTESSPGLGHVYIGDSAYVSPWVTPPFNQDGQTNAALVISKKKNNNSGNPDMLTMTTSDAGTKNGWLFQNYTNSNGFVTPRMYTFSNVTNPAFDGNYTASGYLHDAFAKSLTTLNPVITVKLHDYDSTNLSGKFNQKILHRTLYSFVNGLTPVFVIDSNENVGIGTNSPTEKLQTQGNMLSIGNVYSKGTSWTLRTSAADNNWISVTYGNGLFVAVSSSGTGNRVMTSPDGINWTSRTSAADNSWNGVTYGNGLFVAVSSVGTGNRVMTSPDGINWTSRTSAADNDWISVTYGNGLFVAVSNSGPFNRVMTSPDGINWTIRSSAAENWRSVTYGNGLFVAVSSSGTGNRVMTSPDGINWTSRTSAADNNWRSVTYGNGLFVAVAGSGTGNRVMASPDGINWTSRASAADNSWYSVTYGNGLFVAVAQTGTGDRVMTSGFNDYIALQNNNTYQGGMNIFGNVGLGTSFPASNLHIVGKIATIPQIIRSQNSKTQNMPTIQLLDSSGNHTLEIRSIYTVDQFAFKSTSVFIGDSSGINVVASPGVNRGGMWSVGVGHKALQAQTTGYANVALGGNALDSNQTLSFNIAIGTSSLHRLKSGSGDMCAVGDNSGNGITTGSTNVIIGSNTGQSSNAADSDTETENIYMGAAAANINGGGVAVSRSQNVFIGRNAGRSSGNMASGNVLIGYNVANGVAVGNNKLYIANSNTSTPLVYGEFDNKILSLSDSTGRFGIRTKTPTQALHVAGQLKIDTITTGSSTDSNLVVNNGIVKKVAAEEGPVMLAKGTVTNTATLDIDMSAYYTIYDYIEIRFYSARPVTNTVDLYMRVSSDAVSYAATGYKWNLSGAVSSTGANISDASTGNATGIQLIGSCSNVTERTANGVITIHSPGSSTFFPTVLIRASNYNTTPAVTIAQGTGVYTTAQVTKAVRLYFSTGNISNLSYKVIGYKN